MEDMDGSFVSRVLWVDTFVYSITSYSYCILFLNTIILNNKTCIVILGNFIGDGIVYALGVMIGHWAEYYQASLGTVAFIGSIMNGLAFGNGPIVACFIKKFEARRGKCLRT